MKDLLNSPSAFIVRYGEQGWRVREKRFEEQFPGQLPINSGIVEIKRGGLVGFINGNQPWSFNHPSVHMLYDEARLALRGAGLDLPCPPPQYPGLEQMIGENLRRSPLPDITRLRELRYGTPVVCYADYTDTETRALDTHAQAMIGRFWGEVKSNPLARNESWAEINICLDEPLLDCHYRHYDPRRMQIDVIGRPNVGGFTIRVLPDKNQWSGNIVPLEESIFQEMLSQAGNIQ